MSDLFTLLLHLIVTVTRLVGPGGARSVVAESVLVKHQLLILNRSRKRAPNLRASDRIIAGLCTLLMRSPFRHRAEAFDSSEFPSRSTETKVPLAVFG
jgi:hypothetical protein